ncbi:deuterosome assembly protein 1-like [Amia ocellicauda]|uniref:deuterosome assembly protein 1-like n=1 Tax=Amia ocellicauda TaxID=2972642 RepID=UPI003463A15A
MEQLVEGSPQHIHAGVPSCEVELQELMHQIDIMVSHRKLEWERHRQALEERLETRERELRSTSATLNRTQQEVGRLHHHIEETENTNKELVQKYEERLNRLQSELRKLKSSYEKIQQHHLRQAREDMWDEEDSVHESSMLNKKLEEFRVKSKEWEKQRTLYQKELVSLECQRRSLMEKCEHFQQTCRSNQSQLSGGQVPGTTQAAQDCEVTRLRSELEVTTQRLQEEVNCVRRELQKEKQQLLQALQHSQSLHQVNPHQFHW